MTDAAHPRLARIAALPRPSFEDSAALTARRYAREARLKAMGIGAVAIALGLLLLLVGTIVVQGHSAFFQTHLRLDVTFDAADIDPQGARDPVALARADYQPVLNRALDQALPGVTGRQDRRALRGLLSAGAGAQLRDMVVADPSLIGQTRPVWLIADDEVDQFWKGHVDRDAPEADRRVDDRTIAWLDRLAAEGRIETQLNRLFFTSGDSREPEMAGIRGALIGSAYMMLVTLLVCVPVGIAAAVYLEEFASKSRMTDVIEVNVNNLAAVPSIVFGLLGLAVFLNVFGLPRSSPLVGGLTLALLVLPTIVVATRAALRAVPPSIRQAALGIGASRLQTVAHHVLPMALPGILTGTIIGMAHALGETAPLLMIGMKAFIVDVPSTPLDPASALPVQIYIWADSPERAFAQLTAAAIIVLLAFLVVLNSIAIYMRRKLERRW
ncbi:MAG TPA: phosphate ABC transporter permease PstA [Geminicoccaceae bacterium]|nr:phosphate ABC transporter permease PstA [Geminicoccus sp.]HMU52127.1 phosphate ABC transporter permease PstA [Geminicoccaceae bacterium]